MSNTENPATPLDAVESANLISSPGFPIRTPIPTWTFNPAILSEIQLLGNLIGPKDHPTPLPAGIKQYVIIGTGIQTLDSYTMNNAYGWQKYFLFDNRHVILVPNFQDGDGTVPLRMAEISTATATYFVPYQKDYVFGGGSTSHGKLTDNDKVKQIVASILGGSPEDQSTFGYTSQALVNLDKKVDFTLHSNAQLSIVDSATGNTLGYTSTGGIREDLGSGTFIDQDGIEYASIQNNSDPLAVLVNGTSTGNFTLTVNYTTSGGIMAFSYPDVQVQQGTNSQLSFNPSAISLADRSSVPDLRVNKLGSVTQVAPTIVAIDAFSTTAAGNYTTGSNSGLVLGAIAVITTVTVAGTALAVVKRKKKEK